MELQGEPCLAPHLPQSHLLVESESEAELHLKYLWQSLKSHQQVDYWQLQMQSTLTARAPTTHFRKSQDLAMHRGDVNRVVATMNQ
jgi:hypothetical protein